MNYIHLSSIIHLAVDGMFPSCSALSVNQIRLAKCRHCALYKFIYLMLLEGLTVKA